MTYDLTEEPQGHFLTRTFFPETGSEMEWNAAFYRLEDYLRALHVTNKVHQSQIILSILETVAEKHRENPDQSPTILAMRECQERMNRWFEQILGRHDRFPVAGLLPLFLADGVEQWPAAFLNAKIPVDFRRAIREQDVEASPVIQLSRMVPRPLDVNPVVENLFHNHWEKLDALTAVIAFMAAGSVVATVFFIIT